MESSGYKLNNKDKENREKQRQRKAGLVAVGLVINTSRWRTRLYRQKNSIGIVESRTSKMLKREINLILVFFYRNKAKVWEF